MSLHGGTCMKTKGCACWSRRDLPSTQPLLVPSAQSVTDQEQSAGPVLVAWLDWGRSLQLVGLSVTGGGGPKRLSLADTSDRQGTASADRFIKWHFLQLGLQKWGLGFLKSPSLQGPLCVGLDQSFVVVTIFLIWAVWNRPFFFWSSLASLLLTASPLACTLSQQQIYTPWLVTSNGSKMHWKTVYHLWFCIIFGWFLENSRYPYHSLFFCLSFFSVFSR